MELDDCMNRLSEFKVISQPLKLDSTSCSTTRRVIDRPRSYKGDELAELKEELGESDGDGPDGLNVGKLDELSLDSTSGVEVVSD